MLNLPKTITKTSTGETLNYTYDATGQKLRKVYGSSIRDYIGGIEYSNNTIEFIQTEEGRAIPGSSYTYEYMIKDHLGNTRAMVKQNGEISQVQDYYAFGLEMNPGNAKTPSPNNLYRYNGKEKQTELSLDQLDYGARFYDPVIGRWNVIDQMAEKYFSSNSYNYVDNNPILRIDPDGNDWIVSTSKDKNGNLQINLIYFAAVMNSSGKNIDMKKFMSNQTKEFKDVFGQGNVNAQLIIREVESANELNDFESLIDIQKPDNFRKNEDGSYVGGGAAYGGKFIKLNAKGINENGGLVDKKSAIHEIGHTGGLIHTFEPTEKGKFFNGKTVPTGSQQFYNSENSMYYEANFMNYTKEAAKGFSTTGGVIQYFNNTVGKATKGQIQTIINNLYDGNLNYNNIPKKRR